MPTEEGAAVAEWLSSWLAEQEDRGSIPAWLEEQDKSSEIEQHSPLDDHNKAMHWNILSNRQTLLLYNACFATMYYACVVIS